MSESNKSKEAPKEDPSGKREREFIRETIEEKTQPGYHRMLVIPVILALAVVFGLIVALTFVIARPRFESLLAGTEEETRETVQIPRDSLEGETASEGETDPAAALDEKALRESVESMVDGYLATMDTGEADSIYTELVSDMTQTLRQSIVTVTSQKASEDIFQQQYIRSQETFGLVLTVTSREVLILTETYLLEDAEHVTITLADRSRYDASFVGMDATTGIAVVSIPLEDMSEADQNYVEPVTLGNSYSCQAGDTVVAMGNPMGYVPSVAWGIISYIDTGEQGIDMNFQRIQTDIAGSSQATGILVNLDGQVVGWITQSYNSSDSRNMVAAISISDIKGYIEAVSNGQSLACLGVQVQVVTSALAEERELPEGLYISSCVDDGAAYEAGLQNGDIITEIGGESVETLLQFENALLDCEPGDSVTVKVMRSSTNGYVERDFTVRLGER